MAPGAGSNLRDRDTFPPFSEIPNEDYINKKYWKLINGNTYIPRRHWCFLGEIEAFNNGLVRVLLNVRDIEGHRLPIYFHTEDRGASIYDSCREGYTVAVLYPAQHYFIDGDSGFRVEDISNVKIFPYSLKTLLAANDTIFSEGRTEKCSNCGKNSTRLSHCGRCGLVYYCGKECQTAAWTAGHKSECRALKALSWFTERNWESFQQYLSV